MRYTVFDIECDGLLNEVTKIHCLSYTIFTDKLEFIEQGSITDYNQIKSFFLSNRILVGHNIIRYDIPVVEKLLGIKNTNEIIDTLGLSWYLFPTEMKNKVMIKKKKHGLEIWGEHYGVPKPVINDWENLDTKDYIHRCEVDVQINSLLFRDEMQVLRDLYGDNPHTIKRVINYLNFKLDCAREQEENPCYIDRELCEKNLIALEEEIGRKTEELSEYMPVNKHYKTVKKPVKMYKADGSLSAAGEKWIGYMNTYHFSADTETYDILEDVEKGNPNSVSQVKDWLMSLGWQPTIFKESKSKATGIISEIPQITDDDGNICRNIKSMYKDYPYLKNLENLALMRHRKGIFEAFLDEADSENRVVASIGGFTNSLRMQHRRPIVNLPKVGTYLGEEIRGTIIAPNDDYLICGSDVHALEDTTKQHYMYFFDPEYVNQMRVPGFDPHLDIAKLSGLMTEEEIIRFKELKKKSDKTQEEHDEFQILSDKRFNAKTCNFACVPVDTTEVLTEKGWKTYQQLTKKDKVFSYNENLDSLEIVPIDKIHFYKNVEVMEIRNDYVSLEATENHRWYCSKRVRTRNKPYTIKKYVETKDLNGDCRILQSAGYHSLSNDNITHKDCEILAWIIANGWLYWSKTSKFLHTRRNLNCGFKYSNEAKHIDETLMSYQACKTSTNNEKICLFGDNIKDLMLNKFKFGYKSLNEIDFTDIITSMSYTQRESFIDAFFTACNAKRDGIFNMLLLFEGNGSDAIILALTLNGYSLIIQEIFNERGLNVSISVRSKSYFTGQRLKKTITRSTDVFCISDRNSNFIMRQGSCISITGNSVYGAGAPKLAKTLGKTLEFAKKLHSTYWKRNKAVKDVASNVITKRVNGLLWLYNPISKFWYSLRVEKDIFSTLNQGTGAYIEDRWIWHMRKKGIKMILQYHDEIATYLKKESKELYRKYINDSMEEVNQELKLNVPISVSIDFGSKYSEIH